MEIAKPVVAKPVVAKPVSAMDDDMSCGAFSQHAGTKITKCAVTSSETYLITLTSSVCARFSKYN